jgi:hypothetical protein
LTSKKIFSFGKLEGREARRSLHIIQNNILEVSKETSSEVVPGAQVAGVLDSKRIQEKARSQGFSSPQIQVLLDTKTWNIPSVEFTLTSEVTFR